MASATLAVGEDFPLVCETCLGSNPYVRMEKIPNGVECKISKRPCTGFEWRVNGVKKQTCVAYSIAAQKNICQVCMTDLTFGLPVGVRDAFLKKAMEKGVDGVNEMFGTMPKSRVGMDYMFNQQLAQQGSADAGTLLLEDQSSEAITSLVKASTAHAQEGPGFRFRLPEICPAWVNDASCKQKRNCSKRPCCGLFKFPELPPRQAEQLEAQLKAMGPENVKIDEGIRRTLKNMVQKNIEESNQSKLGNEGSNRTLFVSNLSADVTENQVRDVFSKFPGLKRVNLIQSKNPGQGKVAFVDYSSKNEAQFVFSLSGMMVAGNSVQISWAKPSASEPSSSKRDGDSRDDRSGRNMHKDSKGPGDQRSSSFTRSDDSGAQNRRQFARHEEDQQQKNLKKSKLVVQEESSKSKPPSSSTVAPLALQNALKLRKAKGLDDD